MASARRIEFLLWAASDKISQGRGCEVLVEAGALEFSAGFAWEADVLESEGVFVSAGFGSEAVVDS